MEIVGVILIALLMFGSQSGGEGQSVEVDLEKEEQEGVVKIVLEKPGIVSNTPIFERGQFYKSESGYYISDLSSEPVKKLKTNCVPLVADLSQNKKFKENKKTPVTKTQMNCEG